MNVHPLTIAAFAQFEAYLDSRLRHEFWMSCVHSVCPACGGAAYPRHFIGLFTEKYRCRGLCGTLHRFPQSPD